MVSWFLIAVALCELLLVATGNHEIEPLPRKAT